MKPRWEKIVQKNPWIKRIHLDYDQDEKEVKKLNVNPDTLPIFIFFDKDDNELLRLNGEIKIKNLMVTINDLKDK
jgi:hypothetical protein